MVSLRPSDHCSFLDLRFSRMCSNQIESLSYDSLSNVNVVLLAADHHQHLLHVGTMSIYLLSNGSIALQPWSSRAVPPEFEVLFSGEAGPKQDRRHQPTAHYNPDARLQRESKRNNVSISNTPAVTQIVYLRQSRVLSAGLFLMCGAPCRRTGHVASCSSSVTTLCVFY